MLQSFCIIAKKPQEHYRICREKCASFPYEELLFVSEIQRNYRVLRLLRKLTSL